ncbi:GIY-YIG nuclease family protein [Bacillus sp. UMB0728]|uniref:GIY-YIG nuclease family protein n=1 Tax=Bacillus sp. UMB0728 TaxID=2066052 RepID=UPI000C77EE26|nr:GIY-YIG nuclease family protein [Bacillus sp. UMB0728]PLR72159.1 hypothetical protein CYJ37_11420 [Bacillus sp. UMB0728]
MSVGIYQIRNIYNDKVYIGKSFNIEKRWRQHRDSLLRDKHVNKKLQRDFNIFKKDAFQYKVLVNCAVSHLDRNESLICYEFDVWNKEKGYNIAKLLDYRKISHQDAIQLKDEFLSKMYSNNKELIKSKGQVSIPIEWISKNLNKDHDEINIALKEITLEDELKYGWSINLCSNYGNTYLDIFNREVIDEIFDELNLFNTK